MYFSKFLFLIFYLHLVSSKDRRDDYKFGKKAHKKEYKMVAHVNRYWEGKVASCGGTIISMNQVMTSMLCLYYVSDSPTKGAIQRSGTIKVQAGSIYIKKINYIDGVQIEDEALQERTAVEFITPLTQEINRKLNLFEVDLLLLKLDEPFQPSDSIRTAYLYVYEPTELQKSIDHLQSKKGPLCHVLSWGYNRTYINSPRLWTVRVKFITNEECKKKLCDHTVLGIATRRYCNLDFDAMGIYCAKYEKDNVHDCFGDLGDPVVCMTTNLFGVMTFRIRTDDQDCKPYGNLSYPFIFTRVEKIKRFTQEHNLLLRSSDPIILGSQTLVVALLLFVWNVA